MQPDAISAPKGLANLMHNVVSSNHWAHQRYINWLSAKPIALMDSIIPSSFPTIKNTLVHIWATERFWLTVLKQTPPPPWMNSFDGPVEEVFSGLLNESKSFEQYVHFLDDVSVLEERTLNMPWAKGTRCQYDFITHCMSHSAYHRGQVITIARNLGIEGPPMTDYNAFLMMS